MYNSSTNKHKIFEKGYRTLKKMQVRRTHRTKIQIVALSRFISCSNGRLNVKVPMNRRNLWTKYYTDSATSFVAVPSSGPRKSSADIEITVFSSIFNITPNVLLHSVGKHCSLVVCLPGGSINIGPA